jgi:hypothetical protein
MTSVEIALFLDDDLTVLDAVEAYDVLARLPGAEAQLVSQPPGPTKTELGLLPGEGVMMSAAGGSA